MKYTEHYIQHSNLQKTQGPVGGSSIKKIKTRMEKLQRKDFQDWGKQGGQKTALLGKKHYSEIGKKGALKRWGKKLQINEQKDEIK